MISLIAVVDEQGGLGKNNQLLCHMPADLRHFKAITQGKPVIMGRKTYESMGKLLPGRSNIILSRQPLMIEGALVAASLEEALLSVKDFPNVMIIGGALVYEQAMKSADEIYLTVIHHQFDADVFFPKIHESLWQCVASDHRSKDEKNPYDLTFYRYVRKKSC